jgi:hypothetical protein
MPGKGTRRQSGGVKKASAKPAKPATPAAAPATATPAAAPATATPAPATVTPATATATPATATPATATPATATPAPATATPATQTGAPAQRIKMGLKLPFENTEYYSDKWSASLTRLNDMIKFKDKDGSLLSVVKGSGDKVVTIKSVNEELYKDIAPGVAAGLLFLFRYRDNVKKISEDSKLVGVEFFNKLEQNREYHARALIRLSMIPPDTITGEIILPLKVMNLKVLDSIVYENNRSQIVLKYHEMSFVVIQLMIKMAEFEVNWLKAALFTSQRLTNLGTNPNGYPTHLQNIALETGSDKGVLINTYAQSLAMDYIMFYPTILYPTGAPPTDMTGSESVGTGTNAAAPTTTNVGVGA